MSSPRVPEETYLVDPDTPMDSFGATHCSFHRPDGSTPHEGFSLPEGFLLEDGQMVLNDNRGGSAHRNSKQDSITTTTTTTTTTKDNTAGVKRARGQTQAGRSVDGGDAGGKGGSSSRGRASSSARTRKPRRTKRALTCQVPDCSKGATYGSLAEATRCAAHKEKGQIDHKHRLCENDGCPTQPSFGWPGESRKRFCGAHRRQGTVDLRNCEHEGCGTRASHGFGKGKARFCALHSPPGSSLVANRPCEKLGCIVSPRFGDEGGRPRFCASHKEPHMVNLKDRRCEQRPCKIQPTFAAPGEKPRFCSKHKSEGHVNVRHKLCRHPGCKLVPTYGTRGTRVPVACLEHSGKEMVDLKRERMRMSQAKKAQGPVSTAAGRAGTMGALAVGGSSSTARVREEAGKSTAAATVGRKRPRGQGLGGNVVVGRRIADAIFTSSQRVLAVQENAAVDESEWEEDSEEGDEDEAEGDSGEESEEEDGEKARDEGSGSQSRSAPDPPPLAPLPAALAFPPGLLAMLPTVQMKAGTYFGSLLPPPLPAPVFPFSSPTAPPIAKTNGGQQRLPFHASPLALLPDVVPREGPAAQALQMAAAAAAVASAADEAAQDEADSVARREDGKGTERSGSRNVSSKERPSASVRRVLPGFPALAGSRAGGDGDGDGGGDGGSGSGNGDCGGSSDHTRGSKPSTGSTPTNGRPSSSIPPCLGGNSVVSALALAQQSNSSSAQALAPAAKTSTPAGGTTETRATGMGTSLSWNCASCGEVIGADDRHVLVCCGHGLLHKACTAAFVLPDPFATRLPCPKCLRPVNSSLQVFM